MTSTQVSAPVPPLDSGGSADESMGDENKDPQNRPHILDDLPTLNGDIQPQNPVVEHSNSPGDVSLSKSADANGEGEASGLVQAENQEQPSTSKDALPAMNSEWEDNPKTGGSFMHDSSDSDAENSPELIGGMIGLAKTDQHKAHSPLPKPQPDHDIRTTSSQLKKQVLSGEPGGRPSTPFPCEPGLLPPPLVDQLQGHTSDPVMDGDGGVSRLAEGNADGESAARPRQANLSGSRANALESSVVALPLPHVPQPPPKPGSPTHEVYHGGIRRHYNPPQSYSFYQQPFPSTYQMSPEQYAYHYHTGRLPPGAHFPAARAPYIYGGSIMERNADGPPPGHRGVPPPPPPPEENTGGDGLLHRGPVENHTRRFDPKTRRIAHPARDVQPQRENGCHSVPGSPKSVAASVAPSTGLPTIVPGPQDMVRGRTRDEPPLPQQPYHRSLSPPQQDSGRKTPRALSKSRPNEHTRVDQNIPFSNNQRIVAILPRNAPGYDPNRLQYGRGIIRRIEGNAVVVRLNPPHQGKYKLRPCDVFANDSEDVWSRADEFTEKQLRPAEIRKRSRGNAAVDGAPAPKRRRLSNVSHRRPTPGCVGEIVHRESTSHTRQNGHVPSQRSGEEKDMELGPNSRSTGLSQVSRQMNGTNTNSVHHHVHRARYTNPRSQNHQPTSHVAGRTQSRFHISNVHALSLPLNPRNGRVSNDGVTMMDIDETGDRHRPREDVFSEHHPAESVAGLSIGAPSVQSVAPVKGNGLRGLRQKWAGVSKFMPVDNQLTQQQLDYLVKENIDVETVESFISIFEEKFTKQHEVMSFWLNYENSNMFSVSDIMRINSAIRQANKQRQPRLF